MLRVNFLEGEERHRYFSPYTLLYSLAWTRSNRSTANVKRQLFVADNTNTDRAAKLTYREMCAESLVSAQSDSPCHRSPNILDSVAHNAILQECPRLHFTARNLKVSHLELVYQTISPCIVCK